MQWSPDRNGGFSRADPASACAAADHGPALWLQAVNVEAQPRNPHSLLNWMRRMLRRAQAPPARFGRGTLRFLYPGNRKVLAYLREYEDENDPLRRQRLARAQAVELDLATSPAACRSS